MSDTTKGLPGLTFESAIAPSTGRVGRLNSLRNSGISDMGMYEDEPRLRFRQAIKEIDDEGEFLRRIATWQPSRNERMESQAIGQSILNPYERVGLQAAEVGYGESRFDKNIKLPSQLNDIEDARAMQQSTLGVISNSLAKMGVLAGTTAADSWIGLPSGVINLISEASSGNIESAKDAFNAVIDNPVSAYLQSVNEKSEDIFRNYQTSEERNRPWWENIFTANFIGDTLIKNAGFTIGAVIGGKAAVGAIGNLTKANEARDAFKGLAAELGITGKSASEVVELLAKGTTQLEKKAAVKALEESAKNLKNTELGLRIAGGLLAGTGEARIEALNGVSELEKDYEQIYGDLDIERARAIENVNKEMVRLGIDINTPEGKIYYNNKKAEIDGKYVELQNQIAHDKAMAANTIFALNVPLLTFGDMAQWGKLMLGGYAVDRSVVNGIKKAAEKSAVKGAMKTPADLVASIRYAVKGNKLTKTLDKAAAGSRNVLIEMQEEMNQSLFSQTAKAKAMGNTTEFMERLYDPSAVHDTVTWLDAAKKGMQESWLNKEDWVEGFAGGFMGFMGLPSISVRVDENTGKQKPKLTMEGGIWTPIREQNDLYKRRTELVNTLNSRLGSKDFLNYYYGKIGNRHFDSIKEDAVKNGDKKLYEKADHAQLINDAIMFANAGRLQDFVDIVESFENVSDETIAEIKSLFPGSAAVQSYTTAGMRGLIQDNVKKMKRQLDNYMKIADDIRTVYGNPVDDAFVAELTWQTAHLDEIENDLKNIINKPEVINFLTEYKASHSDLTKDLTDYEIVSSPGFRKWLSEKYNDKKDIANKSDLEAAINNASDAAYDMSERIKYIDNISALTSDQELIHKRQSRIVQQQEEVRRLGKLVKAVSTLSTTSKLSEFISAIEEFEDDIPQETLADIKKEADRGNEVAGEFLLVNDMDSVIEDAVRNVAKKSGATEEEINQALDAWNYFKHNSDTAFELISKHSESDVAPDVAGKNAINILNKAVEKVVKSNDKYKNIKKREIKSKPIQAPSEKGNTKLKTTGNKLTKKVFEDIVKDLRANSRKFIFGSPAAIFGIDLSRANIHYEGKPISGYVYLYYKNYDQFEDIKAKKYAIPIAYDANGNEIAPEEVAKLTGPNGENITDWIGSSEFPAGAYRPYSVLSDSKIGKYIKDGILPIARKEAKAPKKDSKENESGNNPGSKTNPHKFIAPNMDMSLLGGDSHAVAELLKSLPEDSEIRFGIMEEDGPIYILAGDSNMRIGSLPRESDDTDNYSGLAELIQLIKDEYAESKDRTNADGLWISEKYVNHIREKRNSGFETIDDNVPLDEIPGFDGIKSPVIMLVTGDGSSRTYHFSDSNVSFDDVQLRAARGAKELTSGFAYLLVPSGKKYIPVMLYTKNVDLRDSDVMSTPFGKRISKAIDEVVKAITTKDKAKKKQKFNFWALNTKSESGNDSLQRLLYFGSSGKSKVQFFIKETCPQNREWFSDDDVVMVINQHDEETDEDTPIKIVQGKLKADGSEYSLRDQIIDALSGLEYETETGEQHTGPLAQVHPSHFGAKKDLSERIREMIDSKMFLTDVKSFDMEMPSFIMDYWSVSQGKFVRPAHPSAKPSTTSSKVTTKKSKTGTEKIVEMTIGSEHVKYNLTTNQAKIGSGKWFSMITFAKAQETQLKKLGYKDIKSFLRASRALAIIADKYGDSETGEDRIGNRVLLRNFTPNKNEGFVITEDGGHFMTASERNKLINELKGVKKEKAEKKKSDEAKRVAEAKKEIDDVDVEEDEEGMSVEYRGDFLQGASTETIKDTVTTVKEMISTLKDVAPEYSKFLDYISNIPYYDDIVVKFAEIVNGGDKLSAGYNKFVYRWKDNVYTNSIVINKSTYNTHTIMHELVHAFTYVALNYDGNLHEDIKSMMNYMQDTIGNERLAKELGTSGMYAFKDPYEFIAEFFSNPKLQKLAKEIDVPADNETSKPTSLFARIINYFADAIRRLIGKKSFFDKLNDTLYSVVDRQVELEETGKIRFKSNEDFVRSRRISKGGKVDGVALSTKDSSEEIIKARYVDVENGDRSIGVRELHSYPEDLQYPDSRLLELSQLLDRDDEYSSFSAMKRLLKDGNVYEYNNGTESSLIGVKDGDVFIAVRALPVMTDDSYSSLIKNVSLSKMPVIIGTSESDLQFYTSLGLRPVGHTADGMVMVANRVFTDSDLYNLGTSYMSFTDVLDSNERFTELRRASYSDDEWNKFSEVEKDHARKCIGI